jgi:hypothetical protein
LVVTRSKHCGIGGAAPVFDANFVCGDKTVKAGNNDFYLE